MDSEKTVEELEELVKNIFTESDTYFLKYPTASGDEKIDYIQKKAEEVLSMIVEKEKKENDTNEQQMLEFLKAKLLNLTPEYSAEAEKILTKYVKFHPKHCEAWNLLGEIYWKKKDIEMAKVCFEGSQKHVKNKDGLVNLSLLMRSLPVKTRNESIANVKLSIEKAKEAVAMDIKYGKAWYTLANGYLNLYFETSQDPEYLKQALKAYQRANEDPEVHLLPEFYFNKGMAHKCERNFSEALECLENASRMDPSWEKASNHYNGLLVFLNNIIKSLESKGGLPYKKFRKFAESLDLKLLGPCSKTFDGIRLELIKFNALQLGKNTDKVVLGKVICQVFDPEPMSFTFCIVDSDSTCFAVTVYNMSEGKGVIIGDSVAIANPIVEDLDFHYKEKHYKFCWIRIDDPLLMVINGKLLPANWKSSLQSISVFRPG